MSSGISFNDPQTSCKCQNPLSCAWSISVEISSYLWEIGNRFEDQICNRLPVHYWCCRNGEKATKSELELLSGISFLLVKMLAQWNPDSNQFLSRIFWICHSFSALARPEKNGKFKINLWRNWFEFRFFHASIFSLDCIVLDF